MIQIIKKVDFCAAHSIAGAGKCANKHGHNWEATITVSLIGGELNETGFIADVASIKQAAYKYDHDDLDNYFDKPTTENVAQQIAEDALEVCKAENPKGTFIVNVDLVETKNNSAVASATNFAAPSVEPPKMSLHEQMVKAEQAETNYQFGGNQTPIAKTAKFVRRK